LYWRDGPEHFCWWKVPLPASDGTGKLCGRVHTNSSGFSIQCELQARKLKDVFG